MSLALLLISNLYKIETHELMLAQNFYAIIWVVIHVEDWPNFISHYLTIFTFQVWYYYSTR